MNTVEQAIWWAKKLRPKFNGQTEAVQAEAPVEDWDTCMWDMAADLCIDAGCPEELIRSVSKLLWPE